MRPTDVPDNGLLCDLLWSDPDKDTMGWGENDRGVSFTFGSEVVAKFLHKHDLDLICRAHQVTKSLDATLNIGFALLLVIMRQRDTHLPNTMLWQNDDKITNTWWTLCDALVTAAISEYIYLCCVACQETSTDNIFCCLGQTCAIKIVIWLRVKWSLYLPTYHNRRLRNCVYGY